MKASILVACAMALFLPGCAAEVLGAPDDETSASASASTESLASSTDSRPFQSFYLPASHEVLCAFTDGRTYRGVASNGDVAFSTCASRAPSGAAGAFRVGVGQTRASNGSCTTAIYVDGVAYNQRASACNASVTARSYGASSQSLPLGGGTGPSLWWVNCAWSLAVNVDTGIVFCAAYFLGSR